MKLFIKISLLLLLPAFTEAQHNNKQLDSLRSALIHAANDTIRMDVYDQLAHQFTEVNTDSALFYTEKVLQIAEQMNLKIYEAAALSSRGYHLMNLMKYPEALLSLLEAQKILEYPSIEKTVWLFSNRLTPRQTRIGLMARNQLFLALLYYADIQEYNAGNRDKMFLSFQHSKSYAESIRDTAAIGFVYWLLGRECADRNKLDSALLLTQKALLYFSKSDISFIERRYSGRTYVGMVYNSIGSIYWGKGELDSALHAFKKGEQINRAKNNISGLYSSYSDLSNLFFTSKKLDSSLVYARKAFETAKDLGSFWGKAGSYRTISSVYAQQNKYDSAFTYFTLSSNLYDSLNFVRTKKLLAYQNAGYTEQLRLKKIEEESIQAQNKIRTNAMIAGIVVFMVIAFLLYRNNRNRKKTNELLLQKNVEIEKQKINLEETLVELRSTQAQLIEKELAVLNQKATELEMQALRAQMNPHFIFNSLNSINRFILQNNKAQASEYLTKFSRLVRMILQNSQAPLITLESELESLQLYLELEAVRFDHHFEFTVRIDDDLETDILKVPPLIIQPYAENAIWHGLMHKEEKGHLMIELYQEDEILYCKITDDGVGRKKAAELKSESTSTHKSMGLKITAERIAMMQKENNGTDTVIINDLIHADGSAAGTQVIIKIPILYG